MSSSDDFIFDAVKARYQFEHDRSSQLDTKVTTLVGWIGLIITIMLAVGNLLFNAPDFVKALSVYALYILGAAVALLIAALFAGLAAYRMIDYKVVPVPQRLIQGYGEANRTTTLRIFTQMMADATDHNVGQNEKKVKYISITWALFVVGMALSSVFIMLQLSTLATLG